MIFVSKKVVLLQPKIYQQIINKKSNSYVESVRNRFHYDSRFV